MTTAHIVTIRQAGKVAGYQLRRGGSGPGQTSYFGAGTHGAPGLAQKAAIATALAEGLRIGTSRGGSAKGRRTVASPTPAAGIRWEWRPYFDTFALHVVASWQDKRGHPRQTSFSTQRNGLDGALDKAIARRTSAGAPAPDRDALLQALRAAYRKGPQ